MYSQGELLKMSLGLSINLTPEFMKQRGFLWEFDENQEIKFLDPALQARNEKKEDRQALFKQINDALFSNKKQ